jgi:hypothetical protein
VKALSLTFDVTHLSQRQLDALLVEIAAQCEAGDDHPAVKPPTIDVTMREDVPVDLRFGRGTGEPTRATIVSPEVKRRPRALSERTVKVREEVAKGVPAIVIDVIHEEGEFLERFVGEDRHEHARIYLRGLDARAFPDDIEIPLNWR